jgi:hypothetical protein
MARADCIITSTYQEIAGKSAGVTAGSVEVRGGEREKEGGGGGSGA